jgi:hypothetical protein
VRPTARPATPTAAALTRPSAGPISGCHITRNSRAEISPAEAYSSGGSATVDDLRTHPHRRNTDREPGLHRARRAPATTAPGSRTPREGPYARRRYHQRHGGPGGTHVNTPRFTALSRPRTRADHRHDPRASSRSHRHRPERLAGRER